MPSTGTARKGRPRRRIIEQVRAEEPDCWLCGHPIDLARNPQTDVLGSTVDEIQPVSQGGSTLRRDNLRHAHRCCNSLRQDRPVTPELRQACQEAVQRHLTGPAQPTHWTRRW